MHKDKVHRKSHITIWDNKPLSPTRKVELDCGVVVAPSAGKSLARLLFAGRLVHGLMMLLEKAITESQHFGWNLGSELVATGAIPRQARIHERSLRFHWRSQAQLSRNR
jgi:hypothetical protein